MKILKVILTFQLLLGFFCFCSACLWPVNPSKVCNVITNLDDFSDDYYAVIACHGKWCDSEWGHYMIKDGNNCIIWWWRIYLIPNNISYDTLDFNLNTVHTEKREQIEIGYIDDLNRNCDWSDADEETNIYRIVQDETWIKMELINTYKWYDVRSELWETWGWLIKYILYGIWAVWLCIILIFVYFAVIKNIKDKK